jgi:hypothetical protein
MTYQPRPLATNDTLSSSRDVIRGDFEIIRDDFAANHIKFSSGADDGKHTRVDLVEQTTFPATAANESWMASREYNSRTELSWRPESEGAAADQFFLSAMPIRAACKFALSDGTITGRNFNVDTIVKASGVITVTMINAAPSTNYFVMITISGTQSFSYTITSDKIFKITVATPGVGGFMVMGG